MGYDMTCDLEHPMESPTGRSPRVCLMCFPCHVLWPTPSSISAVVVCHVLCPITRPMDYPMAYFPWFHGVSRGMPQGTPHDVTQGYLFYTWYTVCHGTRQWKFHGISHGIVLPWSAPRTSVGYSPWFPIYYLGDNYI